MLLGKHSYSKTIIIYKLEAILSIPIIYAYIEIIEVYNLTSKVKE